MANLKYIGKNILNHTLEIKKGDVSGSSSSTGSFGRGEVTTLEASSFGSSASTLISGSFTSTSSSLASRITTAESELGNTLISSSVQIASDISGSWRGALSGSLNIISGSSTSTGSFGKLVGDGFSVTNIQNSVNSQNIYVDHGDTSLVTRLVNITSNSDGNTGLKVPSNPLYYYNRHTNPITGQSQGSDYLYIGGGSGTAGGLFLNSTVTVSPFVYSDYGTLHIRAAGATGLLELSSSLDVRLGNNTQLTGSLEFTGNITGSSTSTGSFGKVTISELSNSDLKSVSSSISTRLTTAETELGNTLISSSAQVDLSEATGVAANATNAVNADNIALSADSTNTNRYVTFTSTADGDGELRTDAGLLYNPSTNVITATTFNGDLSGNATTATTATSVAFSGITGKPTLLSGSAQIADDISGSFTSTSSSLASRITTEEGNVDTLQARNLIAGTGLTGGGTLASDRTFNVVGGTGITANANDIEIDFSDSTLQTTISGSVTSVSASIATDINTFRDGTATLVSGSATSTGSFGKVDFRGTGETVFLKYNHGSNANLNVGLKHFDNGSGGQLVIAGSSALASRIATFQYHGGAARVGIGVTNPTNSSLAISAPADNDIQLDVSTGGNGYYGLGFASSGQHRYLLGNTYSTTTTRFSITAGGLTTAHDRITIYNALGNGREHYVGINKGATNPAHSLDVSGSIVFANGTQSVQISGSATSTGSFGSVHVPDKIGIGTTAPNSMLHVDGGDIRLSNGNRIYFNDTNDYNYLDFASGRLTLGYTADAIQIDMNGSSVKTIEMQASSDFRLLGKSNKDIILEPQGTGIVHIKGAISGSSLDVTGNIRAVGDIIAQRYIVSSSVTHLTQSFSSGSTIFGDSADDTHLFIGSKISGSSTTTGSFGSLFVKDGVQTIPTKTTFTQTSGIELVNTGNNTVFHIPASSAYQIGTLSNKPMVFFTNNTEAGRFDTSQNFLPAGNVSGSSTSTGSFGTIMNPVSNPVHLEFTAGQANFNNKGFGGKTQILGNQVSVVGNNGGTTGYLYSSNSELFQIGVTSTEKIQIAGNNGSTIFAEFTGAYAISGSSTSTGSFGHLVIDGTAFSAGEISDDLSWNDGTATRISGSSTSTGSFGKVQVGSRLILPSVNNNAAPTLAFGDGNTGFYETSDNTLSVAIAGNRRWYFAADTIFGADSGGPAIMAKTATATQPVYSFEGDLNTGIGKASADNLSLITAGKESLRVSSTLVSGSSTSTGSFGQSFIDSQLEIGKALTSTTVPSIIINDNPSYRGEIGYSQSGNTTFFVDNTYDNANAVTEFRIGGSAKMTLKGNGGVGIGAAPAMSYPVGLHIRNASNVANLKVHGGSGYGFDLWQDTGGNAYVLNHDNARIQFITNHNASSTIGMEIKANGNIEFPSASTISGSSTSTGSFGRGFFKSHVGVGGANPDDYLTSANNLVIKEAGNGGITIIGGTSNTGNIHFGDGTGSDSRRGMIRYDHSTDKFIFWTAGGEKLNLDSSGNLEVTSGNISGSSTSTGSFGSVETKRMVMSSTAAPRITFSRVGEGSADIFLNSAGTGLIVDSGVPIQLDYTTFLSIEKAGTEVARFTANGGLAFGDSSSTTSVLTIKSDSNSPISFEKSSNRQNYLEFKKTSGNLTQPWLIGVGTDATGTEFRVKNGSATPLTIASGSGNTILSGSLNVAGTTSNFRSSTANEYTTVRIDQGTAQYGGKLHFGGLLAGNADYVIGELGGIWDYDTSVSPVALIRFETGADTTNRDDGRITFWTSEASRNPVERMRIDYNGKIGIGETSPLEQLSMEGNIFLTDTSPAIYFKDRGVGDSFEIKRDGHTSKLTAYSSGVKSSEIHLQARAAGDGASRGGILFRTATHQHAVNGPKDAVYINLSGSVELMRDGANLSGSATSTGSFGKVTAKERMSIFSGLTVENEAALSIYADNRKSIHIDHDSALDTAVYIDNTNAISRALQVYSNVASGQNTPLIDFTADNTSFDENVLYIKNDGTADTVNIVNTGAGKGIVYTGGSHAISGSSTSTGSFGQLDVARNAIVDNKLLIGTTNDARSHKLIVNGDIGGPTFSGTILNLTAGTFVAKANNDFEFHSAELGEKILTLNGGTNLISGSATSTGSFGRVEATSISASLYQGQIGSRYVHSQTSDSATWVINHNIGHKYPVVTVYDSSDEMILPETGTATDSDTFTLTFSEAIQGKAVVSVGGIGENAGANYIHTQAASSTNWRVTHSLSQQYPNVTVYDDTNQVIIPESITAASSNEMDITFSSGKTGYANFSIGSGIPNISAQNAGKVLKVRSGGQGVEWSPTSNDVSGSMSVSGSITPTIDNFHDLGSASYRWANLYTGDIQLSNEGSEGNEVDGTTGSWTIQEGEDDLYLLNRKNGKKYKFKLEEIT